MPLSVTDKNARVDQALRKLRTELQSEPRNEKQVQAITDLLVTTPKETKAKLYDLIKHERN